MRCANNFIVIRCKYKIYMLYLNTISGVIRQPNLLPQELRNVNNLGMLENIYENYAVVL